MFFTGDSEKCLERSSGNITCTDWRGRRGLQPWIGAAEHVHHDGRRHDDRHDGVDHDHQDGRGRRGRQPWIGGAEHVHHNDDCHDGVQKRWVKIRGLWKPSRGSRETSHLTILSMFTMNAVMITMMVSKNNENGVKMTKRWAKSSRSAIQESWKF